MKKISKSRIQTISSLLLNIESLYSLPKLKRILSFHISSNFQHHEFSDFLIVDVGSHEGKMSRVISQFYPGCRILCFEPNTDLHETIRINLKDQNFEIIDKVVSNSTNKLEFHFSTHSETSSLILPNFNSRWFRIKKLILGSKFHFQTVTLKSISLDDYFQDKTAIIDYLKIDVEGAEFFVLQGAMKILENNLVGYIQFENHINDMRESRFDIIVQQLLNFGFLEVASIRHASGKVFDHVYFNPNYKRFNKI